MARTEVMQKEDELPKGLALLRQELAGRHFEVYAYDCLDRLVMQGARTAFVSADLLKDEHGLRIAVVCETSTFNIYAGTKRNPCTIEASDTFLVVTMPGSGALEFVY